MRLPLLLAGAAMAAVAGCAAVTSPAHIVTGMTANSVCHAVFVGGQEPKAFYREALQPAFKPVGGAVEIEVDRERHEVTASLAGLKSRAVYRGADGCLVVHGAEPPLAELGAARPQDSILPPIAGAEVVTPTDPALVAALDRAFADTPGLNTKAIVVVHDGKVIAERYRDGYGPTTPMAGWSMSKSVVNALTGIMVRKGWLDMQAPAPVPAWANAGDPRHKVTPDQLLRMTSGLRLGDSLQVNSGRALDFSTRMMFVERDPAGTAAKVAAGWPPGEHFAYADASTLLLGGVLRDALAARGQGGESGFWKFSHEELFDLLGMGRVAFPLDATGTPLGAAHIWAPPRDWARFGMLYVNDGVVGGRRILPEGWVDYSARMSPVASYIGYGAGFWTNRGEGFGPNRRKAGGMPADAFMARGAFGQFTVIVPSAKLVIVRMGYSYDAFRDMDVIDRLTADMVAYVERDEGAKRG